MILKWWKNFLRKREEKRKARIARENEEIKKWENLYFDDITFPILIFYKGTYAWLAVSDIREYYLDTDINIYFIDEKCEMIDASGNKFNFKEIEDEQWVPDKKIGIEDFETIKDRIKPKLSIPHHKKKIDETENIHDIIELLIS